MTGAKVVNNAVIKDINKVVLVFQVCLKPIFIGLWNERRLKKHRFCFGGTVSKGKKRSDELNEILCIGLNELYNTV